MIHYKNDGTDIMKKRVNTIKKNTNLSFIFLIIAITIFMLTYGYAAFSDQLTISGAVAHVRIDKVIRVNAVTTSSGYVSDLDYSHSSIISQISIPANESITYNVKVNNLGNVPMAVSGISFTDISGQPISGLISNINDNNYVKICTTNNVCTNGVEKTFNVTITNNTSNRINQNIRAVLSFDQIYNITYNNSIIGEALANRNFNYTFTENIPANVVLSGTYGSKTYSNDTLTIQNVNSDIIVYNAYSITYEGEEIGIATPGSDYTKTFTKFPKTIQAQGTYGNMTYQNHTVTITNIGSDIILVPTYGEIYISSITRISSINVERDDPPTFDGMTANFNIKFKKDENSTSDDFEIVYEVVLNNDYYEDYIFRGFDFNPIIRSAADSDTAILHLEPIGVTEGETISAETTKTFRIRLWLEASNPNGSYTAEAETGVDTIETVEEETGEITATISPITGDLRSPIERVAFTLSVTSTYENSKEFRLLSSNSNLQLVDGSNNPLGTLTINGDSTQTYTVYIRKQPNAAFLQNTATTDITLSPTGMENIAVDTLTFNVDKFVGVDSTKVTVANATIDYDRNANNIPSVGGIKVTWDRIDEGGTPITDYVVLLYTVGSNNNPVEGHTNSGTTSYTFTDSSRANGTYYAIVYGIDGAGNSGADSVNGAQQAQGYATRSANKEFNWRFNVNTSGIQNLTVGGDGNTAYYDTPYTLTVTASGRGDNNGEYNTAPTDLTVTMGGTRLTINNGYTYTRSASGGVDNVIGTLVISNPTGDITVSGNHIAGADGGCLIEGTKVLLANGTYKNVENINYDDLLLTYSYESGEFVPEYPIWIENGRTSDTYQETTFSDGTVLKTHGYHGVFETELNRFVSVDNPEEFHIGSKIAKINKNKTGFDTVEVVQITEKQKTINYYQIASTRYFNIIADDFLTTDGHLMISNLYGFTNKMTWDNNIRTMAMKDVYTYDELKDVVPYYIFKGMRAEEGKVLSSQGLTLDAYRDFLALISNHKELLKLPIQKFNNNFWMVTTSEDNLTNLNQNQYLKKENSIYTLPKSKTNKKIKWLNTSDNKVYKPGDKITVYHGMYFKAIYN